MTDITKRALAQTDEAIKVGKDALALIDRLRAENARLREALRQAATDLESAASAFRTGSVNRTRLGEYAKQVRAALKEGSDHG